MNTNPQTPNSDQLQVVVDSIVRVWYKQGIDIRGADLSKFLVEVTAEINRPVTLQVK